MKTILLRNVACASKIAFYICWKVFWWADVSGLTLALLCQKLCHCDTPGNNSYGIHRSSISSCVYDWSCLV